MLSVVATTTKHERAKLMEMESLRELYIQELRDLYNAEGQIVKALPKMAKAASSDDLRAAFEEHLEVTKKQVERLEQIFEKLGEKPKGKKCKGMEGLLEEGKELLSEDADPDVLDAGMICAAQKVEHYEIAGYGTARAHANMLGLKKVAKLLQQTLDEEARTDKKLSQLAESAVNIEALQEA
jgi:ferritin-like metal-binding protein YciE